LASLFADKGAPARGPQRQLYFISSIWRARLMAVVMRRW
jgi:hypothetical protein